jgi:hypothetical protein
MRRLLPQVWEVIDAGEGWRARFGAKTGRVMAVFRRAAYLDVGGELLAVCDASAPAGPIHLRVRQCPRFTTGASVALPDLAGIPVWRPPPVDEAGLDARKRFPYVEPTLLDLDGVVDRLEHGDLLGAARLLGGRGPGLTPAGDDILAGILVVSALGPVPVDPATREAAATIQPTTAVARSFLRWAARGQTIAPVHELLAHLSRGDDEAAADSLRVLRGFGATSGTDLAYGVLLALTTSTSRPRARVFDT